MARARMRRVGWVATAALLAGMLVACGSEGSDPEPLSAATVNDQGCVDWEAASPSERAALVRDLGYPESTFAFPDVIGTIVGSIDDYCASPEADPDLGLGGAIEGTGLAMPGVTASP